MKAQGNWPVFNPGEDDVLGLDFTYDLAPGDSVDPNVAPVWTCTLAQGSDSNPQAHLDGNPTLTTNTTYQAVTNFTAANVYILSGTVKTVKGATLTLWNFLACRAPGQAVA